jgi:hypothetical protein
LDKVDRRRRTLGFGHAAQKPGLLHRLLPWLGFLVGVIAVWPLGISAEESYRPLEFEVRPSGVIAETPDEALDRRLRQRDALFRSICKHCSRGDRFSSDAPFKPFEALAVPTRD